MDEDVGQGLDGSGVIGDGDVEEWFQGWLETEGGLKVVNVMIWDTENGQEV